jgi:hypothetical protein
MVDGAWSGSGPVMAAGGRPHRARRDTVCATSSVLLPGAVTGYHRLHGASRVRP